MLPNPPLHDLNDRYALAGKLHFQLGNGGLILAAITTPAAEAQLYLHGAHVTYYHPLDQEPLLFLSAKSQFAADKPIRGGVPICLPWFAAKADDPAAPMHGTARLQEWTVRSTAAADDGSVRIVLTWSSDTPATQRWFPHSLSAVYTVTVGAELRLDLEVTNTGKKPFTFTEALHSYIHVADVRHVRIEGLEGVDYLDKAQNFVRRNQGPHPIEFKAEVDSIYLNTTATTVAHDVAGGRNVANAKSGSNSTVIWNPWEIKAKALPDLGDDEWQRFVCIETANVADNAVTLQPGASHTMTAALRATTRH